MTVLYLPSGYKDKTYTREYGRAESGEISPSGLVQQTEDWEGRESALVMPSPVRVVRSISTGEIRTMTMDEMIEKGRFIIGKGPQ
jgi:hypothetical protein